jgi:hypothetical protein
LMSPMPLTVSASTFMHHWMLIGLLLSAYCAMFVPLSHIVFTCGRRPLACSRHSVMRIGLVT